MTRSSWDLTGAPAVTVVIPTKQRRQLLMRCLAAVLAQTEVSFEVVVVDDGSEDDTATAVEGLGDPRIRLIRHQTSRGPGLARNAGAQTATSKWLAFCDDDDLWAPDKLASQLAQLTQTPRARWSASGCVFIDADGRLLGAQQMPAHDDIRPLLESANAVPAGGSGVLMATALFFEAGGFTADLIGGEDWDMWLRCAALSPIAYVDRPLVAYRRWPGRRSSGAQRAFLANQEVRRRAGITGPGAGSDRNAPDWLMDAARRHTEAGERVQAARAYLGVALRSAAPSQVVYAAAALTAPKVVEHRLQRRDLAHMPTGWAHEAEAWLAAVSPRPAAGRVASTAGRTATR